MSEQTFKLRLPTSEEWDRLVSVTNGDDDKMHWKSNRSFCQDQDKEYSFMRVTRGNESALGHSRVHMSDSAYYIGFRPVLEPSDPTVLHPMRDGTVLKFGALVVNGDPIKVPQDPSSLQDTVRFNTLIKWKKPDVISVRDHGVKPAHEIQWIKAGDLLIADRNLLCDITMNKLDELGVVTGKEIQLDIPQNLLINAQKESTKEKAMALYEQMRLTHNQDNDAFYIAKNLAYLASCCEPNTEIPLEKLYDLSERLDSELCGFTQPYLQEERLDAVRRLLEKGMSQESDACLGNLSPEDTLEFLLNCSDRAFVYAIEATVESNLEKYAADPPFVDDMVEFEHALEEFQATLPKPSLSDRISEAEKPSELLKKEDLKDGPCVIVFTNGNQLDAVKVNGEVYFSRPDTEGFEVLDYEVLGYTQDEQKKPAPSKDHSLDR